MTTFTGTLLPHQRPALAWLLATPKALLTDDVGLGKTVEVLALLGALRDSGDSPAAVAGCFG